MYNMTWSYFALWVTMATLFGCRQGEYIYYASHSIRLEKQGEDHRTEAHRLRKRAIEEKRDSTILGLIDGFLESALQLLLQIYIAADSGYYVTEFPICKF